MSCLNKNRDVEPDLKGNETIHTLFNTITKEIQDISKYQTNDDHVLLHTLLFHFSENPYILK